MQISPDLSFTSQPRVSNIAPILGVMTSSLLNPFGGSYLPSDPTAQLKSNTSHWREPVTVPSLSLTCALFFNSVCSISLLHLWPLRCFLTHSLSSSTIFLSKQPHSASSLQFPLASYTMAVLTFDAEGSGSHSLRLAFLPDFRPLLIRSLLSTTPPHPTPARPSPAPELHTEVGMLTLCNCFVCSDFEYLSFVFSL